MQNGVEPSSSSSSPATLGQQPARPRKFTIQSQFGRARQPRSRKNRPCDACRRRKTACVIPSEPPCLFCKSRGLVCQSSSAHDESASQQDGAVDHNAETASDAEFVSPPRADSSPALTRRSVSHSSPAETVDSSAGLSAAGDLSLEPPPTIPAALVHHGLTQQPGPTADDVEEVPHGVSPPAYDASRFPVHTLEDNFNRTAHSMGPSAEQDADFLDAFRCLLISEKDEIDANIIQVYPGGSSPDDRPVHFLLLENENPDFTNEAKQTASDSTERLVWPFSEHLVRLYFRHVHPIYPVVTKTRFLRQYASNRLKIPASLRGAIYAMACVFWGRDPTIDAACPCEQHQLVDHAHEALRREHENPNLFSLQSCLLLHHITPPDVDSVETPSMWTMAAQTTACAQTIGLHQDPTRWSIEPWEKRVRKKLWWAVYATDCWSAICHGNPPHIGPTTFSTIPPDMDDIRGDEDVPESLCHLVDPGDAVFQASVGARFLEFIKMTILLRQILDCSFQINPIVISPADKIIELAMLRNKLKEWHSLLPQCLSTGAMQGPDPSSNLYEGPLHLTFYATQTLLYRGLMYPATRAAKVNPESNLRKWFVTALTDFEGFVLFFNQITDQDLRGFWCRHARSQLILCGNFLIYLFLLASDPRHIEAAYQLLENFHQALQRLGQTTHTPGRLMLRPARLRLDSFFAQASNIIRRQDGG